MKYTAYIYENFEELLHSEGQTASLLLTKLGLPTFYSVDDVEDDSRYDWIIYALIVYDDVKGFAYHALTQGEYAVQGTSVGSYSELQLKDYVDLERFGVDLVNTSNPYSVIGLPNGKVVVCENGFS